MDISIFGGTGFVGSRFCDLSTHNCKKIKRESRMPESDDILYLISTTHNYHVFDDVHKDVDVNLTILLDVLKNLKPEKSTFNFISSWFVYGETELPAQEGAHCSPKGFYSITKLAAEQLIISYCETFKIDYRILRLCNVYGSGDAGVSKKKNALQYLINEIASGNEIGLYHDGHFYRDYMYLDDVVRAVDLCVTKGKKNEIYNIGSGEKKIFRDIILQAKKILNSDSKLNTMEPPDFHKICQVKDFYMNTEKLKSLGFKPQVSIEEGVAMLCQKSC